MKEQELQAALDEIRKEHKAWDMHLGYDYKNEGKRYVTQSNVDIFNKLISLFRKLNWHLALNKYKHINYTDRNAIRPSTDIGKAVKIRPCSEEYNDKTYFGIYLGDIARGVDCNIDVTNPDILNVGFGYHNPAILVPELNKVFFGCESWWGMIESEKELETLITDDTINNVWYVKLLKEKYTKEK